MIVTPFYSYPMPFIRYELGDLAEAGTVTPSCGQDFLQCAVFSAGIVTYSGFVTELRYGRRRLI